MALNVNRYERPSDSYVIAHLSDLHVGLPQFERNFELFFPVIEKIKPDVIVITGDLVDSPNEQYIERAKEVIGKLKSLSYKKDSLFLVLGNHDRFEKGLRILPWPKESKIISNKFSDNILSGAKIIDSNGIRIGFIGLDSAKSSKHLAQGIISPDQLTTFESDASNIRKECDILVACLHHHPLKIAEVEINQGAYLEATMTLVNSAQFLRVLSRTDVDIVLNGHHHFKRICWYGEECELKRSLILGAGSAVGASKFACDEDQASFNTIHVTKNNKIDVCFFGWSRASNSWEYELTNARMGDSISGNLGIIPLEDNEQVRNCLIDSFSNHAGGDIQQTFVGSDSIAGERDYIQYIPLGIKASVKRYFIITSPFELNFACHSRVSSGRWQDIPIENYYWHDKDSEFLPDIFTNITAFPNKTVLTFSYQNRQSDSQPPIFRPPHSKNVIGLSILSNETANLVNKHLEHLPSGAPVELEKIKEALFGKNPVSYLLSVCYSIAKEISACKPFNKLLKGTPPAYIGIVGSFVDIVQNKNRKLLKNSMDIDMILFLENEGLAYIEKVFDLAARVAGSHSIGGKLSICVVSDISPIHNLHNPPAQNSYIINLIINDIGFHKALPPSRLIASTRARHNLQLTTGRNLLDCYAGYVEIQANHFLDEPLGLHDMKNQIQKSILAVRKWDLGQMRMTEEYRSMNQHSLNKFCKYAVKWASYNYLRLVESIDPTGLSETDLAKKCSSKVFSGVYPTDKLLSGNSQEVLHYLQRMIEIVANKGSPWLN